MTARADALGSHLQRPRTCDVPPLSERGVLTVGRLTRAYVDRRYDVGVHGVELLPASGPVLLASNHMGLLDGPVLGAHLPRVAHALIKKEAFDGWLGEPLRRLGQIPLDRRNVDPRAIKMSLRVLRDGGVVVIYPEGSRGAGDFAHSRLGAAYLALCTGAPIMPVACLGTREPNASISTFPPRGSRIDLVFGSAFALERVDWPRAKPVVAAAAEDVRRRLAAHVREAAAMTGQRMPGPAPDEGRDAAGRAGVEVGPDAGEPPHGA